MFFSPTKTLLRNTSKAIPSRFRTGYAYPFGSGFAHRTSKMPVLASESCIQGRDSCTPSNFSHYSPLISTPRLLRKPNFAASQVHQYTSTESPLPSTPPETESDSKVVSDQEYNIRLGKSKSLIQRWVMWHSESTKQVILVLMLSQRHLCVLLMIVVYKCWKIER